MQQYLNYLSEKKGQNLEVHAEGFYAWSQINDIAVFIHEVFIDKAHRGSGLLKAWTDELVRKLPIGVEWLFCEVDTKDKAPEMSLGALLKYGCKIHEIRDNRYIVCYYKLERN
jgi:hypothetical protein